MRQRAIDLHRYSLIINSLTNTVSNKQELVAMKFTHKEFAQIESTVSKLDGIVRTLCESDSTAVADIRALSYIMQELRTTAGLMADQDNQVQQAGLGRVLGLFANLPG